MNSIKFQEIRSGLWQYIFKQNGEVTTGYFYGSLEKAWIQLGQLFLFIKHHSCSTQCVPERD